MLLLNLRPKVGGDLLPLSSSLGCTGMQPLLKGIGTDLYTLFDYYYSITTRFIFLDYFRENPEIEWVKYERLTERIFDFDRMNDPE